jgi:Fungal protein kinase
MSVELLTNQGKIRHDYYHDLESLFFVLVYLCTNLSGPGTIRSQEELKVFSSIPLSSWFKISSLHQIGINKAGALCNFRMNVLNFFAPYFEDLKPCMIQLFNAMYHKKPGNSAPI